MLVILALLVAYPLLAPIVPAKYDKPIVENATSLYAGQTLTYKLHACRYVGDGVLTTTTRKLISDSNKTLTPIDLGSDTFTNSAKCSDGEKTVVVPYSTPSGTYQLQISGIYSVIPLRKPITVTATSDSFQLNGATTTQDIQALIDANTQLEAQIKAQIGSGTTTSKTEQGTGSNQGTTTTTTTTNNNTTTTPAVTGSGSTNQGILPGLFNILGGGGLNLSL